MSISVPAPPPRSPHISVIRKAWISDGYYIAEFFFNIEIWKKKKKSKKKFTVLTGDMLNWEKKLKIKKKLN